MHKVKVLYKRNGENVGTLSPISAYVEGAVDLSKTAAYCISWDNDMLVTANVFEVVEVELPEWMDGDFYAHNYIDLKYTWGMGADTAWDEATIKGLMRMEGLARLVAIKLLKTKTFRSNFRQAMRDALVKWLENSNGYASPWTPAMFSKLTNAYIAREYKSLSSALYHSR